MWGKKSFLAVVSFGQNYHVDHHSQLALKQLKLYILKEMHKEIHKSYRLKYSANRLRTASGLSMDLEIATLKV